MTSLFQDPKIRQHFPCKCRKTAKTISPVHCLDENANRIICPGIDAEAVLKAMEEPIKAGDRILWLGRDGWQEDTSRNGQINNLAMREWIYLRLPDKFQKPVDSVSESETLANNIIGILRRNIGDNADELKPYILQLVRVAKETK